MVSALRPLHRLTHLRLVIQCHCCHGTFCTAAHTEAFVAAVRGSAFDFDGTARALVYSFPSLRYLFLETDGRLSDYIEYNRATRGVYEK